MTRTSLLQKPHRACVLTLFVTKQAKATKIDVFTRRTVEVFVTADLDTLLIALYVELTDAL